LNVFIDTEIWAFAYKEPKRELFASDEDFKKAVRYHATARSFLEEKLTKDRIYMSTHQLAEIYHVLSYRGIKLPKQTAKTIINSIIRSDRVVIVDVKRAHFNEALERSVRSCIHIWDFLCIIPVKDKVDVAYSMDKHFLHREIRSLVPRVENPIGEWRIL